VRGTPLVLVILVVLKGGDGATPSGPAVGQTDSQGVPQPDPADPQPGQEGPKRPFVPPGTATPEMIARMRTEPTQPLSPEEVDKHSALLAENPLSRASDLVHEQEGYDDAVKILETLQADFPHWLRGGKGYLDVQEKLALYRRFAGFRRELKEALQAGPNSRELSAAITRVEGGKLPRDLRELSCVGRFQEDARSLIGDSAYDAIAIAAYKLDELEDRKSDGLED